MARLHIVRHPQCVLNAQGRMQGRGSNSPYTPLGWRQLDALVVRLRAEPLDLILHGTNRRHRILAEQVGNDRGVLWQEDAGLAEMDFGGWECLTKAECEQRDPELWQQSLTLEPGFTFPDGSSRDEAQEQVRQWLGTLNFRQDILAVTSGFTIRTLLQLVTGTHPSVYTGPCMLTTLQGNSPGALSVVRLMESDYLPS